MPWTSKPEAELVAESAEGPVLLQATAQAADRRVFRAFSVTDFLDSPSWQHLEEMLVGNGGSYGLYGPRGSGKSWLMMRAIAKANDSAGLGLWFPCPSQYNSADFLSALSDNLASAVERRNSPLMLALRRGQLLLIGVATLIFIFGLVNAVLNDIVAATAHRTSSVRVSVLPEWMFVLLGLSLFLLIIIYAATLLRDNTARGRLVREASSLRERIRFTASLRLGSELGVSVTKTLASSFRLSREKSLDERPTSVASLIFDFRNLAELIAATLPGPLVIGIDELDKIENAEAVRDLLRDIKGIFEVTGVHFLVSISEEAANTLQLGTLQASSRNEFNSSFYTVIELPPLAPADAKVLLEKRGYGSSARLTAALCLLSGGNQRELIRMADACAIYAEQQAIELNENTIMMVLGREALALQEEAVRTMVRNSKPEQARYGAWTALPRDAFYSVDKFVSLCQTAIRDFWDPDWADEVWEHSLQEPWRRLLVRLFVAGKLLAPAGRRKQPSLLDMPKALVDLRDVLLAASGDAGIGRMLVTSRFGLSGEYRPGPSSNSRNASDLHK